MSRQKHLLRPIFGIAFQKQREGTCAAKWPKGQSALFWKKSPTPYFTFILLRLLHTYSSRCRRKLPESGTWRGLIFGVVLIFENCRILMIGYRKQNSVLQAGIKYQIWFFVCGVVVNLFTTVSRCRSWLLSLRLHSKSSFVWLWVNLVFLLLVI